MLNTPLNTRKISLLLLDQLLCTHPQFVNCYLSHRLVIKRVIKVQNITFTQYAYQAWHIGPGCALVVSFLDLTCQSLWGTALETVVPPARNLQKAQQLNINEIFANLTMVINYHTQHIWPWILKWSPKKYKKLQFEIYCNKILTLDQFTNCVHNVRVVLCITWWTM